MAIECLNDQVKAEIVSARFITQDELKCIFRVT